MADKKTINILAPSSFINYDFDEIIFEILKFDNLSNDYVVREC